MNVVAPGAIDRSIGPACSCSGWLCLSLVLALFSRLRTWRPFRSGGFFCSFVVNSRAGGRSIDRSWLPRAPTRQASQPARRAAGTKHAAARHASVLRLFRGEPAVATTGAGRRTRSSRMLRQAGRRDARGAVVRAPRNNTRTNRDVSATDCIFAAVGGRPCSTSSENLPARMGGRSCTCRAVDPH